MWIFKNQKYLGKKYGGYTIEKAIGEGRYGVCFLAKSDDGRQVILKKFKKAMFKRNIEKNAFEAICLSQLKDSRIPELLGVINEKGFYGFVLAYKQGDTVKDLLFKQGYVFSRESFVEVGIQLIRIIKVLHEKGIVHRDIRITNVLIHNGEVSLIDFGLARWIEEGQYLANVDFSYLGDFLLYLLYSSFSGDKKRKKEPWYDELTLSMAQKLFLKKLLGIENPYENIDDVEAAFTEVFELSDCNKQEDGNN